MAAKGGKYQFDESGGKTMGFFKKKQPEQPQPDPKTQREENPAGQMDPTIRPGGVFMVQLLMKEKCEVPDTARMTEVLERHIGRVEAAEPSGQTADTMKDMALFAALDHLGRFRDGKKLPVQVAVMPCDTFHPEKIDDMRRSQMWDCLQDRDKLLSECGYCVFANDMLCGALPPLERADFDMDFLEALLELYPGCEAVYCLNSGKLVLADAIRNGEAEGPDRFIRYAVNARFFNISGTGDHIVDTLGLSLLYIEDLQYHFHGMDPNWVVNHAYNMASYILANDRPIKDGDTIDGVTDGRLDQSLQWQCHFEDAMVQPKRPVLDVHMNEFAAGNR